MDAITTPPLRGLPADLWQQLADHMSQLVWISDGKGTPFWFNRRTVEYTGLPLQELEGSGWLQVIHPDDRERVGESWQSAVESASTYESIFQLRGAEGTYRQFLSRAEPMRGSNGAVSHWFGTITDITEQLAREEEAQHSAERLRRAAELASIFVWETDGKTGRTTFGENAAELLGIPEDKLPHEAGSGTFFVDPADEPRLHDEFHQAVAARRSTITVEFKDRKDRHWRAESSLVYEADGSLAKIFGATREVTAERARVRLDQLRLTLANQLEAAANTDEALNGACALLGQELNANLCVIANVLAEGRTRVSNGWRPQGLPPVFGEHELADYGPERVADLLSGQPVIIEDVLTDPRTKGTVAERNYSALGCRSSLDVPIMREGEVVALLGMASAEPRIWSALDVALAQEVVQRTWQAVERLRAEQQLRLSEAQFRSTAEALPGMLFVTDATGRSLYLNGFSRAFTGSSDAEVLDRGWPAIVHPDDLPGVKKATKRAVESGQPFALDYRIRRHDGEWRWHSTRATPARSPDGEVSRWVGVSLDIHERREAEDRARLTAEEIEAIYSTAPVGLAVLDRNLRYMRINDRLAEMNGIAPADHIGRSVHDILPDLGEQADAALRRVLQGEEVWGFELSGETPAQPGMTRTRRENWLPVRASNGEIVGIALSAEEVTASKAAEVALARSEERLRLATSGADVGIWEYDFTTGEGIWSENAQRLIGADRTSFTLEDWSDFIHPDDRADAIACWSRSIADGSPYEAEIRVLDPNNPGQIRWVVSRGTVEFDANRQPLAGRGVIFDVTERRVADQDRREAEGRYRTVFNSAAVGISRVGADGSFLEANDRFCEIVGWSREELSSGGWEEITHPDDVEPDLAMVRRVLAGHIDSYSLEKRYVRKSGEPVWVDLSVSAERDPSGQVKFFISIVEDISERKAAEAALRESEARIRIATEHAEVGFWDVDEINNILTWPPLLKAMFGISPDVPVSMEDFYAGLHPDDLERTAAAYAAAADPSRRALYDVDYRTVGKEDGIVRWIAAKGRGLFTEDGRCERVLGTAIDITARKKAEQALRESEERYRTLFESMEQGFCVIEVSLDEQGEKALDYKFIEINPAFTRESGLPQDVLGKPVSEAIPNLERAWFDAYAEVAITGKPRRFIERAAELQRTFEVFAFRIGDPAMHQVAVLFTDITDRIRQEEALRASEEETRLRLNAIPQMVWSTQPDGFHDFYNDRWYEFTGTPLGTTDGTGWNGMFHPEDQQRAWERWRHALATGEPYEIEYRLRHHTGDYRWVLGRALPIRNEAGRIVRWMGTCTDIDDRLQAERALESSEARLRAILKAVPVGLMFAEADGTITGSNELILDFLQHGIVKSGNTDEYAEDYVAFHEDGRQVASDEYPMTRALRGEERPELECRVRRGDGSLNWLRYVASPIRNPDGEITGGVVASIDIDREKRLTESLEREVEKVVGEREAAQEALRQSQKLEAMGQLTGGVAHDFNNLLTPIIGSLDLLQRKQILDERTGRLVDGALASAEKARVLVQRLLAFARRQPLKRQAVDIGRIVTEMSELIDSTSGPKVRVEVAVPNKLPAALADGNQLEMALLNLSVNARDAMPEGGTLTIAVRSEEAQAGTRLGLKAEPHLVLSVSDTGQGMDEATRRRAIEPFFSTKGVGKGTGLGLSMVHGLAAQLGGALEIRSAVGVGTTIELWLPVADGQAGADRPQDGETVANGAGIALLVDDDELVRASTAGMLADLGYSVVEAESAESALKQVQAGLRPAVLVTDQLMPGISGTDLAVQMREQLEEVPVLIVSGYADLDSLSPAFPHLSKPFRQVELAAALEKLKAGATKER